MLLGIQEYNLGFTHSPESVSGAPPPVPEVPTHRSLKMTTPAHDVFNRLALLIDCKLH